MCRFQIFVQFFKHAGVKASSRLQTTQIYFHCKSAETKKDFIFSETSALVVRSSLQNRKSFLMSGERILHLSTWNNICWQIHWKRKQWSWTCFHLSPAFIFIWSFTSSGISEIRHWIVPLYRDIRLIFASLASRSSFTMLNKQVSTNSF